MIKIEIKSPVRSIELGRTLVVGEILTAPDDLSEKEAKAMLRGGRACCLVIPPAPDFLPPFKSDLVTAIPNSVPEGTDLAIIQIDTAAGDFDASAVTKPSGLLLGGMLQIVNAGKTGNAITFTNDLKTYTFPQCGDLLCLRCDGLGGFCITG